MVEFIGKQYVSDDGAETLADLRVGSTLKPQGTAPISMLARVPSDECGCPEELWRLDGIDLLFHFEEDGQSEALLFAGDWEMETTLQARSLDDLRAKSFQWFADVMDFAAEPETSGASS
ncbi:hypothetical protein TM1040_1641 [Ruegeria sp. TM1040]|uniref:hypothetical protein n=1 Tax=Ruegeria sp. (strain TM1040) TaxID=292414 RepID=UPI0000462383|nr:hypothetical protein [Ruegeria sp. TM1040]ABF64374.1 hypothetical protein TM1040_1641 [Ruegeria sp. TM1040]